MSNIKVQIKNPDYDCVKTLVNTTPGKQFVLTHKDKPGIYIEVKNVFHGNAPFAFNSIKAAEEFVRNSPFDDKTTSDIQITDTSDSRFFKPGDVVYIAKPSDTIILAHNGD